MNRKYIVYLTTNSVNDMIYIGVHHNKKENPFEFDGYLGSGVDVLKAIKEFGRDNFKRETLFVFDTKEEAQAKERKLVTSEFIKLVSNYNRTKGGGDWPDMTEETLKRMRENHTFLKGKNNPRYGMKHTEESKRRMSKNRKGKCVGKDNAMYGKTHTKKVKEAISQINLGRHLSEEHKEKISIAIKGRIVSEETRRKLSIANTGKIRSEETCKKISIAKKGKCLLEEHKEKISIGLQKHYASPESDETRKKISDKATGTGNPFYGKHHTDVSKFKMSEASKLPVEIVGLRREDVRNIPKTWGWKTKLARKWEMSHCEDFLNKYASDLI